MSEQLWKQAEELASKPYDITFEEDTLSDGQTVYLARNPGLPGCKAQGDTREEARAELAGARIDYIHALLEEGLPIPAPSQIVSVTGSVDTASTSHRYMAIFHASGKVNNIRSTSR